MAASSQLRRLCTRYKPRLRSSSRSQQNPRENRTMRNLRPRFGGLIVPGILAAVLGTTTTPAFAEIGQMGGSGKNTCAFVLGMLFKVPADFGAAGVFARLFIPS